MAKRFPTKDQMRAVKIFNSWEIGCLAPDKVYVSFSPMQQGRAYRGAKFQVIRIGYKTDPESHWMDDGHKTFDIFGRDSKDSKRKEACDWADARYGKREWVRDPWGSWQDARTIDAVQKLIEHMETPISVPLKSRGVI